MKWCEVDSDHVRSEVSKHYIILRVNTEQVYRVFSTYSHIFDKIVVLSVSGGFKMLRFTFVTALAIATANSFAADLEEVTLSISLFMHRWAS